MSALTTSAPREFSPPRRRLRLRSDAALGERFARGDESAFAVLYERHRASVLAICMGVLGSRFDAEDALQETFASLAIALGREPPRDMRAWLTRVSRNAAIDVARRRKRVDAAGDEVPDAVAPAGAASVAGELHSVLEGIRELPESQRTALLMRELAGHSYREIASLLDIEEQAVRGLIARARIGLREHRSAAELSCAAAREVIASEPGLRARDRTVRRHVRGCGACRDYVRLLRDDARVLRGIAPVSGGGLAAGGAFIGGLGAKGALMGGVASQLGAACAVSVCAVGGFVLISPHHGIATRSVAPARHGRVHPRSSVGPRRSTALSPSTAGVAVSVSSRGAISVVHAPQIVAVARPASSVAGRAVRAGSTSSPRPRVQPSDPSWHGASSGHQDAGRTGADPSDASQSQGHDQPALTGMPAGPHGGNVPDSPPSADHARFDAHTASVGGQPTAWQSPAPANTSAVNQPATPSAAAASS
jgi:RNA polymerase sigma factor (sigma-70 family)